MLVIRDHGAASIFAILGVNNGNENALLFSILTPINGQSSKLVYSGGKRGCCSLSIILSVTCYGTIVAVLGMASCCMSSSAVVHAHRIMEYKGQ